MISQKYTTLAICTLLALGACSSGGGSDIQSPSLTPADFYMYYPYTSTISDVENMPWNVKADQSKLSDYKASDLLIGKTTNVAPTASAVHINAKHVMSQIIITLVAGNGFTETSRPSYL